MDLYRVGAPSVGETWPRRFNFDRSTGGLGTGVYAFLDREAAEQNIKNSSPDSELIVLENAVESPIQPRTFEGTKNLVSLSRFMDLLYRYDKRGEYSFEEARDAGEKLQASDSTMFGTRGFGTGKRLTRLATKVIYNVPELRDVYGYDSEALLADFVDATEEAAADLPSTREKTGVQPINKLLYPRFDGVAPVDSAGGNTGKDGCVIFKERVDAAIGRETVGEESLSAAALNRGLMK